MSSNMSLGQVAGYVVGAVVGYFTFGIGAVAVGAAIGGTLGGLADPPKGPTTRSAGPRLSDQTVQTASYGANIPCVYGATAVKGNLFWVEGNRLKETVTTTTTRSGGKGGGGGSKSETTTYSYSATFAIGLCKGPISGVRRIWAGSKLIYDANATTAEAIMASNAAASGFVIYNGSETQNADPRMQADRGVANVPAYRGLAYIVFYDFQLRDYGNSLLGVQIKVELLGASATPSGVALSTIGETKYTQIANANAIVGNTFEGYGNCHYIFHFGFVDDSLAIQGGQVYHDYVNGRLILSGFRVSAFGSIEKYTKSMWYTLPVYGAWTCGRVQSDRRVLAFVHQAYTYSDPIRTICVADFESSTYKTADFVAQYMTILCQATYGQYTYMCIYGYYNASTFFTLVYCFNTSTGSFDLVYTPATNTPISLGADEYGWFVFESGYIKAYSHGSNTLQQSIYFPSFSSNSGFYRYDDGFIGFSKPSATIVRADASYVQINNIGSSIYASAYTYEAFNPKLGVLISPYSGDYYIYNTIKTSVIRQPVSDTSIQLSSIVSDQCLKSKILSSSDIDVTAMTQTVKGYLVSSPGSIRKNIEPLQTVWPFDMLQSGYKIKFKARTSSVSIASLTDVDIGATTGKTSSLITIDREMDLMLPNKVVVTHIDVDREYDAGEQYAERITSNTVNEVRSEIPVSMTATEAAQKAETLVYMYWLERQDFAFVLPPSFLHLEPADVITLTSSYGLFTFRVTQLNYTSSGIIEVNAKLHSSAIYSPTAVGGTNSGSSSTVDFLGPSFGLILDIPLIDTAMNKSGILLSAYGASSNWRGCVVTKSTDNQSWVDLIGITPPNVTSGYATSFIGSGRTDIIDKSSVLNIKLNSGSLNSVSELLLFAGSNHFAYGVDGRWEIIAAQTVALQGDGSYNLTNLLRGRIGTEWATSLHDINDLVILLDHNTLYFAGMPTSNIGVEVQLKFVTFNDVVESAQAKSFIYRGVNLECLSPVQLSGFRSSNDWNLSWTRRTRINGDWLDNADVPLGETSEAYDIEIYTTGSYTTVARTLFSTSPSVVYSAANQVTDFGSAQSTLYVKIYQISEIVGRGYPLQSSITR